MKKAVICLFCILTVIACNNKKQEGEKLSTTDTPVMNTPETVVSDSAAIRSVILDFYTWYNSNYRKLMGYQLYTSLKKNNAAPYKLNWAEANRYMVFIQDSIPQLGDAFIGNQKELFAKADSAFKVDLGEDVPVYFDYDWYTNSQEDPGYLLDGIKQSTKWLVNVKGDSATVEIGAPDNKNYVSGSLLIQLDMKKENGQWKIARIGND